MRNSASLMAAMFVSSLGTSTMALEPVLLQPIPAQPQLANDSIDGRLDRVEQQLRAIQQHLGLYPLVPATYRAEGTANNSVINYDRIANVELETRRLNERLTTVKSQLDRVNAAPPTIPTQGRLAVRNLTGSPHYISVNNTRYVVQPGRTDIWVPYQVVEAYLPSHESPKLLGMSMWRWTGQDFEMPLDIRN